MAITIVPSSIQLQANTSGGWTPYHYLSTASTNATNIKSSAGSIGYIIVINTTASVYYLKLFNKASSPTVGTDTPVMNIPIPANASSLGGGAALPVPAGINFSTGISFALTGAIADNDTTNAAAGIVINIGYL